MVEPRPAAACIIMRENGEILLARRSTSMKFMGGHHVFPGGRIDEDEGAMHVVDAPDELQGRAIHAVAREVFEETGLLTVRGTLPDRDTLEAARSELLAGETGFDGILARHGLRVWAEDFEPAGVWVTPPRSPIRFDTQYYLYRHQGDRAEVLRMGEMISLDWLHPNEARKQWHLGQIQLPTPVAHTLRMIGAAPYPAFLDLLAEGADRRSGFDNRFELRRGIQVVALKTQTLPPATHTNCVLIGEREVLVIDPGAGDEQELAFLKEQLDQIVEFGGTVKAVILTHSHSDHVEGAVFVRDLYKVPILAHEAVGSQVKFSIDRSIVDGECISSAGDPEWLLRAVHTPGHDPGHLCFLEESTRTLIGGDMIANPGTIVVSLDSGGNMTHFLESLERLIDLDATLVIPAHGMPMDDPREKLQEHLDHRLWREQKIKDALAEGVTGIGELLSRVYNDVPKTVHPLAEHALRAHLARIEAEAKD